MNCALDATYSVGRNLSGVGVYSREILGGLAAAHPTVSFSWCYRPHRLSAGLRDPHPLNVSRRLLLDGLPLVRADLFHALNQRMPRTRFRRGVCTFHDLFVLTADYSSAEFRARFARQAREAAERADLIICVSAFTAAQVEALLRVERARLRVIAHGLRFAPLEPGAPPRQPVVLHVGALQRRKNLVRLIEAFENVAAPPWRLVLAGSDGYGAAEIHARIERSPARARIEVTGWVDDLTLASLYRRATVFAFPSLDEGFGIPVLEAMGHGVPVLAANRSALPEACGEAALMVDPCDQQALNAALLRLLEEDELRQRLISAGRLRAAEFTWARAVTRTWEVYTELF